MPNPVVFEIYGIKSVFQANTKVYFATFPQVTTTDTIHLQDGTNYQVPVGKKAKVLAAYAPVAAWLPTDLCIYADNLDGTTNAVTIFTNWTAVAGEHLIVLSDYIPAGKYINKNTANNLRYCQLYIIEEDV